MKMKLNARWTLLEDAMSTITQPTKAAAVKSGKTTKASKPKHVPYKFVFRFTAKGGMSLLDETSLAANREKLWFSVEHHESTRTGKASAIVMVINDQRNLRARVDGRYVPVGADQFHLVGGELVEWFATPQEPPTPRWLK